MRKWISLMAVFVATSGALSTGVMPSQAAEPNTVEVNNEAFMPAEITVTPGTTVTWRNIGTAPHSAKAEDGSFNTDYIVPGEEGQATFAQPGEFRYFCEPHPWKKGVVRVQ